VDSCEASLELEAKDMGVKIAAPDRDPFAFMFAVGHYRTATKKKCGEQKKTAPMR
jgi:hypothetical protein